MISLNNECQANLSTKFTGFVARYLDRVTGDGSSQSQPCEALDET